MSRSTSAWKRQDVRELFTNGKPSETLVFDERCRKGVYDELSSSKKCNFGRDRNVHTVLSMKMREIALSLAGKHVNSKTRYGFSRAQRCMRKLNRAGYIKPEGVCGGDVFRHTCMVVAPLEESGVPNKCGDEFGEGSFLNVPRR